MIYERVLDNIKENKRIKESGGIIAIPWSKHFPRLSKVLPGVRKGMYTIITSGPKESKTQLTDFLFVYQPLDFLLEHPDIDIDYKVIYFSLELSKEFKILQAICYRLFTKYGILINPDHLQSVFESYTVDDQILSILDSQEFKEWMEFFESKVEIIDNIRHPTGISVKIENYAKEHGESHYIEVDDWENPGRKRKVFDYYTPNNPNQIVVPIIDHASLLSERGKTVYECIKNLSSEYLIRFVTRYKYSPVLVQQQSSDSTRQQFSNNGSVILDKVRPDREGLANCKDTAMDATLMLGIFSPYKYKETSYENWDLTRLRDYHREISIILNRNGKANATIQTYFNGAVNFFKELPREPINEVYKFVSNMREKEESYAIT
jgi:replicative DNA helicase